MRKFATSVGSLLFLTCFAACPGSDSNKGDAGSSAADSGGDGPRDPDAGPDEVYEGDSGQNTDAGDVGDAGELGGSGGSGGSGGASGSGSGWNPAKDIDPAECRPDPTDFTPCGGDITGKWRLASICFPDGLEDLRNNLMCPELEQEFEFQYRMLVDFKSTGNYTAALKSDALQVVTIPKECISEEADCSLLGEDDTDDSDGDTLIVRENLDVCVVRAEMHSEDGAAGTWQVSGTKLTMTDSDGPDTSDYCVQGDELTVRNVNDIRGTVSWGVFERE